MKLSKLALLLSVAFSSAGAMAQVAPAATLLDLLNNGSKTSMSTVGAASTVEGKKLADPAAAASNGIGAGTTSGSNGSNGTSGSADGTTGSTSTIGSSQGFASGGLTGSSTSGYSTGSSSAGALASGLMGPSGSNAAAVGQLFSGSTASPWVTVPSATGGSTIGAASGGFGLEDIGKIVTIAAPVLTSLNPKLGQIATIAGGGIAAYNAPNFSVTQLVDGAAVVTNVAALVKPNNTNIAMAAQVMGGAAALVTVAGKTQALSGYVNTPIIGTNPVKGIDSSSSSWALTQPGGPTPILTNTTVDSIGFSQMTAGYDDAAAEKAAYLKASNDAAAEARAVAVSPEGSIGYSAEGNGLHSIAYPDVTAARVPTVSTNFSSVPTSAKSISIDPSTNPISLAPTFVPGLTDSQQAWAASMENSVVQAANSGYGPTALAIAQQREAGIVKANQVNSAAWLAGATSDGEGYTVMPVKAPPVAP
jgi:hypothetical protein